MMGGGVAKGLHADAGMTGWVLAKRAPLHAYGRWSAIPMTHAPGAYDHGTSSIARVRIRSHGSIPRCVSPTM